MSRNFKKELVDAFNNVDEERERVRKYHKENLKEHKPFKADKSDFKVKKNRLGWL